MALPRRVDLSRRNLRTDYQRQTEGIWGTLRSLRANPASIRIPGEHTRDRSVLVESGESLTGRRLMAPGTDRRRTFARMHGDLDAFVIGTEAGMLVNEAPEMMTVV